MAIAPRPEDAGQAATPDDSEGWLAGPAVCPCCGHTWQAVREVACIHGIGECPQCTKLECSRCGSMIADEDRIIYRAERTRLLAANAGRE